MRGSAYWHIRDTLVARERFPLAPISSFVAVIAEFSLAPRDRLGRLL